MRAAAGIWGSRYHPLPGYCWAGTGREQPRLTTTSQDVSRTDARTPALPSPPTLHGPSTAHTAPRDGVQRHGGGGAVHGAHVSPTATHGHRDAAPTGTHMGHTTRGALLQCQEPSVPVLDPSPDPAPGQGSAGPPMLQQAGSEGQGLARELVHGPVGREWREVLPRSPLLLRLGQVLAQAPVLPCLQLDSRLQRTKGRGPCSPRDGRGPFAWVGTRPHRHRGIPACWQSRGSGQAGQQWAAVQGALRACDAPSRPAPAAAPLLRLGLSHRLYPSLNTD